VRCNKKVLINFGDLILNFLASRTVRNKFLFLINYSSILSSKTKGAKMRDHLIKEQNTLKYHESDNSRKVIMKLGFLMAQCGEFL
jgi:hypothetical protein